MRLSWLYPNSKTRWTSHELWLHLLLQTGSFSLRTDLITREGFEKLTKELNHLWREYRPEITQKVAWAASLGDRSENADSREELPKMY